MDSCHGENRSPPVLHCSRRPHCPCFRYRPYLDHQDAAVRVEEEDEDDILHHNLIWNLVRNNTATTNNNNNKYNNNNNNNNNNTPNNDNNHLQQFLDWLGDIHHGPSELLHQDSSFSDGHHDHCRRRHNTPSTSSSSLGGCRYRAHVAWRLWNDLHHSVRPFTTTTTTTPLSHHSNVPSSDTTGSISNQSTTHTSTNTPNTKQQLHTTTSRHHHHHPQPKKAKRRIRPLPVAVTSLSSSNVVWNLTDTTTTTTTATDDSMSVATEESASFRNQPTRPVVENPHRNHLIGTTTTTPTTKKSFPTPSTATTTTIITPNKQRHDSSQPPSCTTLTFTSRSHQHDDTNHDDDDDDVMTPMDCDMAATVAIYTTLIHSCLVPSTILELHWLLRLLALSNSTTTTSNATTGTTSLSNQPPTSNNNCTLWFTSILSSPARCRTFSRAVLRNPSIRILLLEGLGRRLRRDLIRLPVMTRSLPDVTQQLSQSIERCDLNDHSDDIHEITATLPHPTALLTIPFQPERDSRHNFRTREGNLIYKNREECRDAFLYQLRTFLHGKGQMVDSTEASRVRTKLRHSSRAIVNDLSTPNISWFAQVFIELLLQIGHIPLQETDSELLQTVDQEKLQKLHSRFSSRAQWPTKSRKILSKTVDPRDNTTPPMIAAQQYFTGHAEFFFLFFLYADSYLLGTHLRRQLIAQLQQVLPPKTTRPTEKEILDARLLARFLGVIVFSPHWQSSSSSTSLHDESIPVSRIDELNQLATAGLSTIEHINDGTKNGNLLFSVSWTVELLKIGQWDLSLKDSQVYTQTAVALRSIQIQLIHEVIACPSRCQEFALIRHILDSFFYEVVGLAQAVTLERPLLTTMDVTKKGTTMTSSGIIITPGLMTALVPQLDDVSSLVAFLSQKDSHSFRSPGVSKKLRPSVVSRASVHPLQSPSAPVSAAVRTSTTASSDSVALPSIPTPHSDSFVSALRDNFFHQHGDLKLICDFVAVRTLKNLRFEMIRLCLKPLIPVSISSKDQVTVVRENMIQSCQQFLTSKLEPQIRDVVHNLAPVETPPAVLEMGIAVATMTINKSAHAMVAVLVEDKTTRMLQSLGNTHSKRLFPKDVPEGRIEQVEYYKNLTVTIDNLTKNVLKLAENAHDVDVALRSLANLLNDMSPLDSSSLPPENSLREFYLSVLQLDDHSDIVTDWGMNERQGSKEDRWNILSSFVDAMFKLKRISHRGLYRLIIRLSDVTFLVKFIELGTEVSKSSSSLSDILCQLITSKLLRASILHDALLNIEIDTSFSSELLVTIQNLSPRPQILPTPIDSDAFTG